jgi:hypothetical protein
VSKKGLTRQKVMQAVAALIAAGALWAAVQYAALPLG